MAYGNKKESPFNKSRTSRAVAKDAELKHKRIDTRLLVGPDGTEHSVYVQKLADKSGANTVHVSGSNLASMKSLEAVMHLKEAFQKLDEQSLSIMFVSEVEKLDRSAKTVLTYYAEKTNIIVIGSTECPGQLDAKFEGWFREKVFVPLPDFEARKEVIKSELGYEWHSLSAEEMYSVVYNTQGYKRDEIAKIVQQAIRNCKDTFYSATHFIEDNVRVTSGTRVAFKRVYIPCDPKEPGAFEANTNFHLACLFMPPITLDHFLNALDDFPKPSKGNLKQ